MKGFRTPGTGLLKPKCRGQRAVEKSKFRLSLDTHNFDIFRLIKLKPQRCTSAIYIRSIFFSELLGQKLHTEVLRTNMYMSNITGQADRIGDSNEPQPYRLAEG